MRLVWNFIGRAAPFTDSLRGMPSTDFQIGKGGPVVLPVKGDLLLLRVSGSVEPVRFKCTGRHFDLATSGDPVLHIDIELR